MTRLAWLAVLTMGSTLLGQDLSFQGLVVPSKQVQIISPLDGIIQKIYVEEGQEVKAGQPLLRLDDALQKLVVEGARLRAEDSSEVVAAELQVQFAQIELNKAKELVEKGAGSAWEAKRKELEFEQSKAGLQLAKTKLIQADAAYRLEQEKLVRYTVNAAFDGRVVRLAAEAGATIKAEETLATLASLRQLKAQLFLPVEMFDQLESSRTYTLAAAEPVNAKLQGRLINVDRILDSASKTFRCTFEIDNADESLPAGFMAKMVWPQ